MKHPSLPVKRQTAKKGALRTLFVNVARKRHRASTSAPAMSEADGDVPNVGVARALVVIFAIHVVAVAGLFIHTRYFETKAEPGAKITATQAPEDKSQNVKLGEGEARHLISTGESYTDIAKLHGVDVAALQEANNNIELRAGNFLRLPPKQIVAAQPPQIAAIREANNAAIEEGGNVSALATLPERDPLRESPPMVDAKPPRAIPVAEGAMSSSSNRPVLVKPKVTGSQSETTSSRPADRKAAPATAANTTRQKESTKAAAATAPTAKKSSKMVVKSGDTLWSIAKANGTTPAALMKANGIKDPSKMRKGMELTIPKN